VCDGATAGCPADAFLAAGTTCRPSAGACDLAETCGGTSGVCPADAKSTAVCRPAIGACDVAESCAGTANDCPADLVAPAGTACRSAAGDCDLAEACDGDAGTCPIDVFRPAGTSCRPAAGACDLAEACNGSGAACPADAKSVAACRPAAGPCDLAEACNGIADDCPPDGKSTTVCHPAANRCELAVSCDGLSNSCGALKPLPAGTLCSDDGATCDALQSCTRTCPLVVGQPQVQTCTHDGVTITVAGGTTGSLPGGAASTITVTVKAALPPFSDVVELSSYASPLYQLSPSGATFNPPLSISFTYRPNGARTPVVYLCRDDVTQCSVVTGTLGTNASGQSTITVQISHFSTAFVSLLDPTDGGVSGTDGGLTADGGGADVPASVDAPADAPLVDGQSAGGDAGNVGDTAAEARDAAVDAPGLAAADGSVSSSDAGKPGSGDSGCSCRTGRTHAHEGLGGTLCLAGMMLWLARRRRRRG
jgi:hypothetical protein